MACFSAFLFLTEPPQPAKESLGTPLRVLSNRPDVWTSAVLEWSVFVSVLTWAVIVSTYLLSARPGFSSEDVRSDRSEVLR